jgi:hypothetical protein
MAWGGALVRGRCRRRRGRPPQERRRCVRPVRPVRPGTVPGSDRWKGWFSTGCLMRLLAFVQGRLAGFRSRRQGVSMVDNVVLAALIAAAVLGAVTRAGDRLRALLVASDDRVGDEVAAASAPPSPGGGGSGGSAAGGPGGLVGRRRLRALPGRALGPAGLRADQHVRRRGAGARRASGPLRSRRLRLPGGGWGLRGRAPPRRQLHDRRRGLRHDRRPGDRHPVHPRRAGSLPPARSTTGFGPQLSWTSDGASMDVAFPPGTVRTWTLTNVGAFPSASLAGPWCLRGKTPRPSTCWP